MPPKHAAHTKPFLSRFVIKVLCILGATLCFIFYWNLLSAIAILDDLLPRLRSQGTLDDQYPLQQSYTRPVLTISAEHVVPKNAHPYIDPTFAAFACEERSFIFYAGPSGEPNVFSRNLLHEVAKRTGVAPIIRVGGTSLDHSTYEIAQKEPVSFAPGEEGKNIPSNLKFGPSFFDSFANLPDATFILDIPLAKRNMSNAIEFIRDGVKTIGLERIEQLEAGNEPNLYPGNNRPQDYGPREFVEEWGKWTDAISHALDIPLDEPTYEAVALASPRYPPIPPWQVQHLFDQGLDDLRTRIKSYSIHYYQTNSSKHSNLQRDVMNHTSIIIGTRALAETVEYLNTKVPRIPLNIGEFGSALNAKTNDYALESVLGSAIWQVDFMLHLLAIGVNRVNLQLGIGFGFAPWQPTEYRGIPAKVNAPYYAHIFIADLIGRSRHMQVIEIPTESDILSAYAAYDNGKLAKIVIVNLKLWSSFYDDPDGRGAANISFKLPEETKFVEVRRLTSAFGATASDSRDIHWAGQSWSWENEGRGVSVDNLFELLHIKHGHVVVSVASSEAVVVELVSEHEVI